MINKKGKIIFTGAAAESKAFTAEVNEEVPNFSELPNGNYCLKIVDGVATWVAVDATQATAAE